MAKKVTIELEAKTGAADKDIANLKEGIQNLNTAVQETGDGFGSIDSGAKKASKGIKSIGVAIKAAGIGLLLVAFGKLSEIMQQNQKIADLFSTTFEVLSIAFNDFANFVVDNYNSITGFFKAIFEDPLGSIKDLGKLIQANIIERFNSMLEVAGYLGTALKKLFEGDFAGALDSVKDAGEEMVDVFTGVDGTVDKVTENVKSITTAVTSYATETLKSAQANVELAKQAELAMVKNQGLIEDYDRQAELLRQTRDDESKSIEERIKANEDLALVLDEQEKAMQANAAIAVERAKVELDKNKESIELQKAYQEALNEQAGIEAQITGFRSEQQSNTNSLLREQKEIAQEIALIGKSEREIERQELLNDYEAKKELIDREVTDKIEKDALLLEAEGLYKSQLKELNDGFNEEDLAKQEENNERIKALEQERVNAKKAATDAIIGLVNAESTVGRAALIFRELTNAKEMLMQAKKTITFSSLKAAESSAAVAAGTAKTASVGFPQNIPLLIGYGIQAVSIFSAIKQAVSKSNSVAGSLGGGSTSGPSAPPSVPTSSPAPPSFNVVGASQTSVLSEAVAGQTQEPVQAYVVANDVTSAQSLQNNIVEGASI